MHRAIRYGTTLGALSALLLGAGCENQSGAPGESTFVPRPTRVSAESVASQLNHTRVTGYTFDPEAFFLGVVECSTKCPQIPPFLLGTNPLFLRSVIRGTQVTMNDPQRNAGPLPTGVADPLGIWVLPRVPSREAPYYPSTNGQGELPAENIFPLLTPLPPADYLPTVSLRPVKTDTVDFCYTVEAVQVSTAGILDAVARYLTAFGEPTSVADFVNPARYAGVTVVWNGNPGFPFLRAPAANTSVEASAGRVIHVEFAPVGVLPPPLQPFQSPRGFFVAPSDPPAAASSVGIAVVLIPAGSPPATVIYSPKDATTNTTALRPWTHPPVTAAPIPGVITYAGLQLDLSTGPVFPPEKLFCRE